MKKAKQISALLLIFICLFATSAPAFASPLGYTVIDKVLVQLSSPPVVLSDPAKISISTSTTGCTVTSVGWYDANYQPISSAFTDGYTNLVLKVGASAGYLFAASSTVYINNEPVPCTIEDGGATLTVNRQYVPSVWMPTINKHPGADKVDEGGTVSFVASADYSDKSTWKALDKNGQLWTMEELAMTFPNFTYHDSFGKLIINGVPKELDGAEFCCTFEGAGGTKTDTNWAALKVNYEVVETPAPTPSPTPTPTPVSSPTPTPTPASDVPTHTHDFSSGWRYDDGIHWHECTCGKQADFDPHKFVWETVENATRKAPGKEKGVCSVCGYEKVEELEYDGITFADFNIGNLDFGDFKLDGIDLGSFDFGKITTKTIIIAAVALLVLIIAGVAIGAKVKRKKELELRRKEALRRRRQQRARIERGE